MIGRGDKHVRMGGKGLGPCGQFGGRAAHDGDVHLVALEHLHQLFAVAHHQFDFNAAVLLAELRQQARQKVFGRADHADGQVAHLQAL